MEVWVPDAGSGPALLVIQEIFGVGPYIRAVAERLAAAGYVVGAPDVFWRFAPGWEAGHDEEGLTSSLEQAGNLDPGQGGRRLRGRGRAPRRADRDHRPAGRPRVLSRGHARLRCRRRGQPVGLRQLLRLRRAGHARPPRRRRLPDDLPLRQRRRLHPRRRRRGAGEGDRRQGEPRAQRRSGRPRLRQPRGRDVPRRSCGKGRLVQDHGLPRRTPSESSDAVGVLDARTPAAPAHSDGFSRRGPGCSVAQRARDVRTRPAWRRGHAACGRAGPAG